MANLENIVRELENANDGQKDINSMLRVVLDDHKQREKTRDKVDIRKDLTIWGLILSLVACFAFFQWTVHDMTIKHQEAIVQLAQDNDKRFKDFMSEYDFASYEYDADATDGGNANIIGRDGNVTNGESKVSD